MPAQVSEEQKTTVVGMIKPPSVLTFREENMLTLESRMVLVVQLPETTVSNQEKKELAQPQTPQFVKETMPWNVNGNSLPQLVMTTAPAHQAHQAQAQLIHALN